MSFEKVTATPKEQLELLQMGTVDFISAADMLRKLRKATKIKNLCRLNLGRIQPGLICILVTRLF